MGMSKESFCLKVSKKDGEKVLILAGKLDLSDKSLVIQKDASADFLFIPITRAPDIKELSILIAEVPLFELEKKSFLQKSRQDKTLSEILQNELTSELLNSLPRALDVIGDIAIIEVPSELEGHKTTLGAAILKTHHNLRTVLAKIGAISGIYRLREFEFIAGEHKTTTLHKEYGCSYYVDVAKAYFSPRLSHEHWRVASLVKKVETIVDLFAGVGPFAIPIARSNRTAKVYAIDINPEAVEYLKKNVRLNKVDNQVFPVVGDARKVVEERLQGVADRVIMNLPETANEFIDVACKAVKSSGGILHFYGFVRMPDTLENFQQFFSETVMKAGRKVEKFEYANTVRATAPYEWQVVLDAQIL